MNGDAQRFKALLQEIFVPSVCVTYTPDAQQLLQDCYGSASFARLCDPWCLTNRKVMVHTLAENVGIELSDFAIRLVDLADVEKAEEELDATLAAKVMSTASEDAYANFKLHHRADLPAFLREASRVTITPWWDAYRMQLLRSTPSYGHELFNLPVACLVLLSTENKATVESVAKLQTQWVQDPNVPAKDVLTDPKTLRHYVVLTDGENKELIEDIRSGLGSTSCTFIKIAKGKADHAPLREFIGEFTFRILIPYLEAKVRLLSDAVSSKRGLMPLVSWFKGPKKADPEPVNLEWLARQLADTLFMLRDYPAALSQYRKIAGDRSEKNMRYAPAAVEMSGVAALMLDYMRKDIDTELERAYSMYQRTNQPRLCIRTTLLLAEVHRLQRNYREMVTALLRCAERPEADDLSSALMQEQASFGLLYTAPPQFRKFAMRLLFAGHRFVNASQQKHAFRCYAFADGIYAGRDWVHIDSHIGSVLARQSFLLQRMDSARQYMQKILESNASSSLATQAAQLREYLHIVSSIPPSGAPGAEAATPPLPELPFPQILTDSIRVFLKTSPVAGESPSLDSAWAEMEDAVTVDPNAPRKRPGKRERPANRERVCGVGEPVLVELSVKNPLHVPLHLSSLHLVAAHRPPPDQPPTTEPAYDSQTADVTLAGLERRTLQLKLTPLRDGVIEVRGLGFEAFGSVWGVRSFNLPRRRLNDTKEHMRTPTYEADSSLTFRVVQSAPLLETSLLAFPSSCFQGELRRVTVELRNAGPVPITRMRVKLSHPACFSFVPPGQAPDQAKSQQIRNARSDPSVVPIPGVLAPNTSLSLPVWLRGPSPGVHQLLMLFCYEADAPTKTIKHRVTKVTFELRATPALRLSYSVSPSATSLHAYVLALCAENVQPNEQVTFALTQITSFSAAWTLTPLSFKEATSDGAPQPPINARETTQMFLRITPAPDAVTAAGATINLYKNVLRLQKPQKDLESISDLDLLMREKEAQRMQSEIDAYANAQSRHLSHSTAEITVGFISNPKKPQQPKAPPPIVDPFSLDVALYWETPNGQHSGVQHVHGIVPLSAPDAPDDADTVATQQPVRFLLQLPSRIQHNFSGNRLCTQPVVLSVKNISPTETITFHLDAMKLNTGAMEGHVPQQHHSRSGFLWTGATRFLPVSLMPHHECSFTLYACFPRPGVYNVNRFRLVLTDAGQGTLVPAKDVYPTAQYLVTVADESTVV